MSKRVDVMISSTARDLPDHRQAAISACESLGLFPIAMEHLPALDANAVTASLQMVEQCEVYVLIVAHRYGHIPTEDNPERLSITHMEYNEAIRLNKPRLVFLVDDGHTPPFEDALKDTGEAASKLAAFKNQIGLERVRATFRSVDNLEAQIVKALSKHYPAMDVFYQPPPLPPADELPEHGDLPIGSSRNFARNYDFQGRETDMLALAKILLHEANNQVVLSGVTGAGGMGKTQLAKEFALRYGRFFYGVHWLNALSDLGLEIAACGGEMKLSNLPENDLPQQIQMTLEAWRKQPQRLVILDNLDSPDPLKEWLPKFGNVRLLITSRRGVWASHLNMQQHALDVLPPSDCRALLRRLAPHLEKIADSDLDAVSQRLGHLPLAILLAGLYINRLKCSTVDYLNALAKKTHTLEHSSMLNKDENYTEYEHDLMAAWLLSWEHITHEDSKKLFGLCGLLAPNQAIPRTLLARAMQADPRSDPDLDSLERVGNALNDLLAWGLLSQNEGGEPIIHPLMADFARTQTPSEELLPPLVAGMVRESNLANQSGLPAQFAPLVGHLELLAQRAEPADLKGAGILWNSLGSHLRILGSLADAKEYHERSLRIFEQLLGENHPNIGTLVNNIGTLVYDMGDLAGAKECLERALRIDEAVYGTNHPNVARDVNNLGSVLKDIGDLVDAKAHYERALRIDEAVYGTDHPAVARDVNNLGTVLQDMGDLVGAKAHFERALRIDEGVYGVDHPKVAIRLNNLGALVYNMGNLTGAKAYLERALRIFEQVLGENHPNVGILVNNLGELLRNMGDLVGAKAHFERALRIDEGVYGTVHPNVAIRLNNLGNVLHNMGDFAGAKAHYERALRIDEAVFDSNHPNMAIRLNNLAHLAYQKGDLVGAKGLWERALRILWTSLPLTHPYIQIAARNLEGVKRALGE